MNRYKHYGPSSHTIRQNNMLLYRTMSAPVPSLHGEQFGRALLNLLSKHPRHKDDGVTDPTWC